MKSEQLHFSTNSISLLLNTRVCLDVTRCSFSINIEYIYRHSIRAGALHHAMRRTADVLSIKPADEADLHIKDWISYDTQHTAHLMV